eukprot:gene1219-1642_t
MAMALGAWSRRARCLLNMNHNPGKSQADIDVNARWGQAALRPCGTVAANPLSLNAAPQPQHAAHRRLQKCSVGIGIVVVRSEGLPTKFPWRQSGRADKGAGKIRLGREATRQCDLGDRHGAERQQRLGALETHTAEIAVWRHAHCVGEDAHEMKGAEACFTGKVFEADIVLQVRGHEVERTP